jgi:hypothetical protein
MSQVIDPPAAPPVDPRLRARRIEVRRSEGRKRLRRLLVALTVTVVGAASWGITRSPLLDVDHVEVVGAQRVDLGTVLEVAGIEVGDPLVDLDLGAATDAITALPWVESALVDRSWWGTVRYEIVERRPVSVATTTDGRALLVDAGGWVLDQAGPSDQGLPTIVGLRPSAVGDRLDGVDRVAVDLVVRAGPGLSEWLDSVVVADESLWIDLRPQAIAAAGGTPGYPGRVQLGDGRELDAQLVAAETVLARVELSCLDTIDVRVPASPVVRRVEACTGGELT